MDLDSALFKLGFDGFYPIGTFIILSWGSFMTPMYILYPSFLTTAPSVLNLTSGGVVCNFSSEFEAQIADDGRVSSSNSTVSIVSESTAPIFCPGNKSFYCVDVNNKMQTHSLAVRWNLVCEDTYLLPLLKSFIFIGYLIGCPFIGPIMDRFGRKRLTVVSHFLTGTTGVIIAFVDSVVPFLIFRVLCGVFALATYMGGYIMVCEMVPRQHRGPYAMAFTVPWAIGTALLPAVAYLLPAARDMTLTLAVPNFIMAVVIKAFVPESPTWLLNNGRREEVEEFLAKEGKKRNVKFEEGFLAEEEKEIEKKNEKSKSKDLSCLALVRSTLYLKITLIFCVLWSVNAVFYYGLNFSSATGKSPYVTFCLNGISELVGYMASICITWFCSRKRPTIILHILAGVFVFLIPTTRALGDVENDHVTNFIIALNMLSKFCITITYVLVWLYVGEVVHTNLRSTLFAIAEFMSRVGGFLAPFLLYLGEKTSPAAPEILVGVLSLISAAMVAPLPETAKKPLPNTKNDVRALMRGDGEGEEGRENEEDGEGKEMI